MSKTKKIFIYMDVNRELSDRNVFISMPYKSTNKFIKDNNEELVPLVTYDLDHLLSKWGISSMLDIQASKIQDLESKLTTANKRIEILEGALNAALGFIDGMYISFKNPEIKDIYNFCKQALEKSAELKKRVEGMEDG